MVTDGLKIIESDKEVYTELPNFNIILKEDILDIIMKKDFYNEIIAKEEIEPYLTAWEIKASLEERYRCLSFKHINTEWEEVPFPKEGIRTAAIFPMSIELLVKPIIKKTYPGPPQFIAKEDILVLWKRFKQYKEGKESLQSMAYACFTYLTKICGGEKEVAENYIISLQVLKKIRSLASSKGTEETARKFLTQTNSFSPGEDRWLESAIKMIILRVGERQYKSKTDLPQITMGDIYPRLH